LGGEFLTENQNQNELEIKKNKAKKKRRKRIRRLLIRFVALAVFLIVFFKFIATVRVIHDNNMYPMLCDGQAVIVSKINKVYIDDIVLYEIDGREMFGRVVAQEGDSVKLNEEGFYINDNITFNFLPYPTKPPAEEEIKVTVPDGSYYVLNDYRERMTDSRTFGCISDIKGTVVFTMKYRGL
jgi:signal peptidase I